MNHPANMQRNTKSGWLRKQGGMVKSWHRRWFVLNGDILFYFAKEDDLRPLGTIFLPGNKIIQHPANPDEPDKFLMEVVPGNKNPQKMAPNHETFLLCASNDAERQEWVKAIRHIMFSSVGGAIFGGRLEDAMDFERSTKTERKIPYIVESSIEFLLKHGLDVEGLFRLPGRLLLVRDLKDRFDEGEKVVLDIEEVDVHSVASLLKLYLRELPECLIPYRFYQEFMNIAMKFQGAKEEHKKQELVQTLRTAMADLPEDNYNLLKELCSFLHTVSDHTHVNKMTVLNLSTVFGPNIIRHPNMDDNPEVFMLSTADISQQLAYMFINYDKDIFTIQFDNSSVAVDNLLSLDDEGQRGSVLLPQSYAPVPARRSTKRSSGINDLSDIVFEQPADRRARSFSSDRLTLQFGQTEDSVDTVSQSNGSTLVTPPSGNYSPTASQASFSIDGKPVPPVRRKYIRKHNPLSPKQSNESVSSDMSGSEKSLNSSDEVETVSNHPSVSRQSSTLELDLQQKLDTLTAEHNALKLRYNNLQESKVKSDDRVKNLSAEMSKIQTRYDKHIKSLEARHKSQYQDLCSKLDSEKTSQAEALKKIMELQKQLQNYQMHYGDIKDKLPPLLPGRLLLVRDLKDRFDEGEKVVLDIEEVDVHSVASLLKLYLRELPECLIPYRFYQEFMNIAMKFQGAKEEHKKQELVQTLRTAMADLPEDNYNLLKELCSFLHTVSDHTHVNKMTVLNLSTVFGPNIIRHPNMDDNPEVFMLSTADISQQLAYMFINYDKDIFTIQFDNSSVAVDNLLSLDDEGQRGSVLLPQSYAPVPARRSTKRSSGINDLSDIVFEQPADRRARSFSSDRLTLQFGQTEDSVDTVSQSNGSTLVTPPSGNYSPTASQASFSIDGKPVPPVRRKYIRKHNPLSPKQSNESVSSDMSGSEKSLNSSDEVETVSNHPSVSRQSSTLELDLQQKLDTLTAEHNALKLRYNNLQESKVKSDDRVKNLSAEMSKIQTRYDKHIKSLEARHKSQYQDLCSKLDSEKTSQAEALKKIMELQKQLQNYQMHYGDIKDKLPPLYP